ncbi:MAG: multiubiquitin domain-containing protein [Lutibacter sp.]
MMEKFKLNNELFEVANTKITGEEILTKGNLIPASDYELLIKVNEKGFEPVQLDEIVDLKTPGIEGFFAKPYKKLLVTLDGKPMYFEEFYKTPNEILKAFNIDTSNYFLIQIKGDIEIGYANDKDHKIALTNNIKFISCEIEIIDIEDHCNSDYDIPKGCKYKIKIDREKYIVNVECMTGREILALANKVPVERFQLNQKFKGGRVKRIQFDDNVDFTVKGIERFMTLPLDQTEGSK